ncbi:triose-phosphate isomerase [Abyssibius alkaniclasticus]|uniref:triose-phosphate isomerase n=1 Tax=Abyssibius alkaniclasticus TaxID=2881234 RepID=UPI0040587027
MCMTRRALVAGNWKMNGTRAALGELAALKAAIGTPECDVLLCPPATLLAAMAAESGPIMVGGQDCHVAANGAHTGDISAEMLADAGAKAVILGHSERRADHWETSAQVSAKAQAAWRAGLLAVVCVGETEAQRQAGAALETVGEQLAASLPDGIGAANLVVAYEPVWAIGTGLVPTLADIGEMHAFMRGQLTSRFGADIAQGVRLLYGGSVKPANAAEIFGVTDVDGALVGGASLKAADFAPIIAAV